MISKKKQDLFIALALSKFKAKEQDWLRVKTDVVSKIETSTKFSVFFSLASRVIDTEIPNWNEKDLVTLEHIYPGFKNAIWTKLDLARVLLMIHLDVSINKRVLVSFFEIAAMTEQVSLYKGLYMLLNANVFEGQLKEGIRTNMVTVFDAIALGNPFAKTFLKEAAWNQLILKTFFLNRPLYKIEGVDHGKNEKLAHMLQDYVKERWAAGRDVSLEIWRMIHGYLRNDLKTLLSQRRFKGTEKTLIEKLSIPETRITPAYWDKIGQTH